MSRALGIGQETMMQMRRWERDILWSGIFQDRFLDEDFATAVRSIYFILFRPVDSRPQLKLNKPPSNVTIPLWRADTKRLNLLRDSGLRATHG